MSCTTRPVTQVALVAVNSASSKLAPRPVARRDGQRQKQRAEQNQRQKAENNDARGRKPAALSEPNRSTGISPLIPTARPLPENAHGKPHKPLHIFWKKCANGAMLPHIISILRESARGKMKLVAPHAQAGGKTRRNGAQKTAVWGLRRAQEWGMMRQSRPAAAARCGAKRARGKM